MLHMLHDFQAFTFISSYFNIFQLVNRICSKDFFHPTPVAWTVNQERGSHQELVAKGGAYCDLLAAAGEMSWSWSDEVNNSHEDNDDNNDQGDTRGGTRGNEALPPQKKIWLSFQAVSIIQESHSFFLQEFVTFDVSPRSIPRCHFKRKTKDGWRNAVAATMCWYSKEQPQKSSSLYSFIQFC